MANPVQIKYGVNAQKATQLVSAGLTATAVMVAASYTLKTLGILAPDFGAQYGAILYGRNYPPSFSDLWWLGMVWHAINGIVILPFLFDYFAHKKILPNKRWSKGILLSGAIWIVVGVIVAPLAGEGFFYQNTTSPFFLSLTSFITWIVYGLVLDGMTRVRVVHELGIAEKRAA